MSSIELPLLFLGCFMIFIGIIGGGFEIKEIKIPKITGLTRFLAVVFGGLFFLVGIGYYEEGREKPGNVTARNDTSQTTEASSSNAPNNSQVITYLPPSNVDVDVAESRGRIIQILSGTWSIHWKVDEVIHDATLYMNGREGVMRVNITFPNNQGQYSIDQRMTLTFGDDGAVYLVGENPVYTGTNTLNPDYAADAFQISSDGGQVRIMLCDMEKRCGEVAFERI